MPPSETRSPTVALEVQGRGTGEPASLMSGADFDALRDPVACTVRYSHLEREPGLMVYPHLGALDEHVLAAMLGCEPGRLREIRSGLSSALDLALDELFEDESFVQSVKRLPFGPADVVVAVGDSITADALSWAEMLARALPRAGLAATAVINAGVSSYTSSDLIANFGSILSANPSYVIAMIGTNDARRHGPGTSARMTSAQETDRHLRLYVKMVRNLARAHLVLVTPPPIDEDRVARHATFAERYVSWRLREVGQVAEVVRGQQSSVVDVHNAFVGPELGTYLTADGIHPSVAGQQKIVRLLVDALSNGTARAGRS
jgi:lysophospholipase L1-like esterase